MGSHVLQHPPSSAADALAHFRARLGLETDCWDVRESHRSGKTDFVLLDVRASSAFERGHTPGALNIHHREIDAERMSEFPPDTVFVVYCAGPHCNAAQKAAVKLAELGRPVKEMLGGIRGWLDEGFELERWVDRPRGSPTLADCVNEVCPWSGNPAQVGSLTRYRDVVVGFCNPGCRDKFDKAIRMFDAAIDVRVWANERD